MTSTTHNDANVHSRRIETLMDFRSAFSQYARIQLRANQRRDRWAAIASLLRHVPILGKRADYMRRVAEIDADVTAAAIGITIRNAAARDAKRSAIAE